MVGFTSQLITCYDILMYLIVFVGATTTGLYISAVILIHESSVTEVLLYNISWYTLVLWLGYCMIRLCGDMYRIFDSFK